MATMVPSWTKDPDVRVLKMLVFDHLRQDLLNGFVHDSLEPTTEYLRSMIVTAGDISAKCAELIARIEGGK